MNKLIGRKAEIDALKKYVLSDHAEFIGLYGRRRVGKTYLVNQLFHSKMAFSVSGILKGSRQEQIKAFQNALRQYGYNDKMPTSWLDMFFVLQQLLEKKLKKNRPCIIFIDELPCFDSQKGSFVRALGQFWNTWASLQHQVKLIVCGSATSWMVRNIISNKGGLHNRLTHEMHLSPFTLSETSDYLRKSGFRWTQFMVAQAYMVFGGVPYYLSLLDREKSLAQNIDRLYFSENGELKLEYERLFSSLFDNDAPYLAVLEAMKNRKSGMTQVELSEALGKTNNSHLTKCLQDLENCDIIRHFNSREKKIKKTGRVYQLVDFFSLFHLHFAEKNSVDEHYWEHHLGKPSVNTWLGIAFERLCMAHIPQIKSALGIDRIGTEYYAWRSNSDEKAQVDLIIERDDKIINLCEIKYSETPYLLKKIEAQKFKHRQALFVAQTQTRCTVYPTFITTFGMIENGYANEILNKLKMSDLFVF